MPKVKWLSVLAFVLAVWGQVASVVGASLTEVVAIGFSATVMAVLGLDDDA